MTVSHYCQLCCAESGGTSVTPLTVLLLVVDIKLGPIVQQTKADFH